MGRLADRIRYIESSPTMAITATVDRLRRAGVEIVDFGAGEPDFTTPEPVKAAARRALDENFTRYTPKEFREKIAAGQHFLTSVLQKRRIYLIGDDHELDVRPGGKEFFSGSPSLLRDHTSSAIASRSPSSNISA